MNIRRVCALAAVLCLLLSSAGAEVHQLWGIDLAGMSAQQVHDYLEREKGILTRFGKSRFVDGYQSLTLVDGQELTLLGFPFSLFYSSTPFSRYISLNFLPVRTLGDAQTILDALITKYGPPTLMFYDLYSRSPYEWEHNIGTPMWHRRRVLPSLDGFDCLGTLLTWEHYEQNKYSFGELILDVSIDNIRIQITAFASGNASIVVTFRDAVPDLTAEDADEAKNISDYTDTGF